MCTREREIEECNGVSIFLSVCFFFFFCCLRTYSSPFLVGIASVHRYKSGKTKGFLYSNKIECNNIICKTMPHKVSNNTYYKRKCSHKHTREKSVSRGYEKRKRQLKNRERVGIKINIDMHTRTHVQKEQTIDNGQLARIHAHTYAHEWVPIAPMCPRQRANKNVMMRKKFAFAFTIH